MSLVRYDWSLMNRLHRELEQALGQSGPVALIPRVDVREEAGALRAARRPAGRRPAGH